MAQTRALACPAWACNKANPGRPGDEVPGVGVGRCKELLRIRLASQKLCSHLSTTMSDEQMARIICFERRL